MTKFVIADTRRPYRYRTKLGRYTSQLEKAWEFEDQKSAEQQAESFERVWSLEGIYDKKDRS